MFENLKTEKRGESVRWDFSTRRSRNGNETDLADVNLEHPSRNVVGGFSKVVPDEGISVLLGDEVENDGKMAIGTRAHLR